MSVNLSLRVTSDKRKPGVKVLSSKEEDVKPIIKHLKSKSKDVVGAEEYLESLQNCYDLKTQLDVLREGPKLMKECSESEELTKFYHISLLEFIFILETKSPLRNGIKRILKNQNSEFIKSTFKSGLKERLKLYEDSFGSILLVTNLLCGSFDNFPLALQAVNDLSEDVYKFTVDNLSLCNNCLNKNTSPTENIEVCHCIHLLVRLALHLCSLNMSADKSRLNELANQLLSSNQLPLDTRTNSALLAVNTDPTSWFQMLTHYMSQQDDLTTLCAFSGVLSCVSVTELNSQVEVSSCSKSALQVVFDKILDIRQRNPVEPTITLCVARTLVSLSKLLLLDSSGLSYILPRLLSYTWEHLEHVMDSVKHLAVTLLHNIAKMQSSCVDVHKAILIAMRSLPVWGRAKHTALSALLGKVPVSTLILGPRDINDMLLNLSQETISSHAVNALQELLKQHLKEIDKKEKWKEMWIKPLLLHLDANPSVPLQQVLNKTITVCPDVVKFILIHENEVSLGTILLCLRQARRSGLLDTCLDCDNKWRGLISYDLLSLAAQHQDEQTCVSFLSLIVEAPKTTECYTPKELQLIKQYATHNLNLETPASRQTSIALLRKFVSRLNESQAALARHAHDNTLLIEAYNECKLWLQQLCLDSLFPGAVYSRRVTALELLSTLGVPSVPKAAEVLLACLADSYEDIKTTALSLLTSTPSLIHQFSNQNTVLEMISKSLEHAGGVKPPESLSAAYLMATVARVPFTEDICEALSKKYSSCQLIKDKNMDYKATFWCLQIVMEELSQQLNVARESLLKAASSAPLYGLLFTAKLLLSFVNLRECRTESWKQLIARLVELSFCCSKTVESVVNSDSPEGHFPMDFDFDAAEGCGEEEIEGVTSQMVLLCSWRTVKEVSLLLGFLVEEASITFSHTEQGLLSSEEVERIGEHLTTLLAETKHRGAFEQAYVGFYKLVARLWRLPAGNLQNLPKQWLEDTVSEISNNNGNLCATRRSAGIPYMIQALVCTQLDVEGVAGIEGWICRLLDLAEDQTLPPISHTHALNILRALFRNTELSEVIAVFVERALIITITAFSASSWMERNSATLLLSALVTRVFGVPRSKSQDNLSWKNKMTGRIFFLRYPKLFDFFQQELRKSAQNKVVSLHPSLYPVLLILGRLYPSSLEGTDSNVQLTQYIPDVMLCASSNVHKTRCLAALAMAALLTLSHLTPLINQVTQQNLSANTRHGLLLQVACFLKQMDPKSNSEILGKEVKIWFKMLKELASIKKLSFMELEALFIVFVVLLDEPFSDLVHVDMWHELIHLSEQLLEETETNESIASCLFRTRICELLLKVAALKFTASFEPLCCKLFSDNMYEVRNLCFDFLICMNSDKESCERFSDFCANLPDSYKNNVLHTLYESPKAIDLFVRKTLDSLNSSFCHPEDRIKILSILKHWNLAFVKLLNTIDIYPDMTNSFLFKLCKDNHDKIATNAIYCLNKFMSIKAKHAWPEEQSSNISQLLVELMKEENSSTFNEAMYNLVSTQFEFLQKSNKPLIRLWLYKFYIELTDSRQWPTALRKIIDSENEVQITAVLLTSLTLQNFTLNSFNSSEQVVVFERNVVNDDYEEYILSKMCGKCLQKLCLSHKNLLSWPLSSDLRTWLASQTKLDGYTLLEFVSLAQLQILQMDSDELCQFLDPQYKLLELNRLKIKNVL